MTLRGLLRSLRRSRAGFFLISAMTLLLAACGDTLLQAPDNTQAQAKAYIDLLRAHDIQRILPDIDASIATPQMAQTLEKMADLIPAGKPTSITLMGSVIESNDAFSHTNLSYLYQFPDRLLVINVAVKTTDGTARIVGFNVYPATRSLSTQHAFSLLGKAPAQYAVFLAGLVALGVSLYAFGVCVRTRPLRRKGLWLFFIAFGIGIVGVDWYTGALRFNPLAVQLFSFSATAAPSGPWQIAVSFPLGAILFLFKRRAMRAAGAAASESPQTPTDEAT